MEHTHHAPTPNDGTNPHAEIAPAPPVDFRTSPHEWVAEHIGRDRIGYGAEAERTLSRAFDSLSALLEPYGADPRATTTDAEALAVLLGLAFERIEWHTREDSRFVRFGALVLPTTPSGLAVLRTLRTWARESVGGSGLVPNVATDSPMGALLVRLRDAESGSGMLLESARNRTNATDSATDAERGTVRIGLGLHARAMGALPRGEKKPAPLLEPDPVGFHVSDPIELQRECDMCDDGTADFLESHGVAFEREGGEYECDSCGASHESEESGCIEWIADFELTSAMVDDIERQGFGDAVREYIAGSADCAESLSALLEPDATIPAPDAEHGIRFDSETWDFVPDFESVEGADEIEGAEALAVGALLARIVAEHTSAGVLPPVDGTLRYRPLPYESRRFEGTDGIALEWNHERGTLRTVLGEGIALERDARTGALSLVCSATNASPHAPRFLLAEHGGEWIAHTHGRDGGERIARMLRIAQARAEI